MKKIYSKIQKISHPKSILYLCEAKSRFYDVQSLISTAFVSVYTAYVSVISHNAVDIDCDSVSDPVHHGVVYAYVYTNDVAQILYYNIQRCNQYDNNKCNNMNPYNGDRNGVVCKNNPQYVKMDWTVHIHDVHDVKKGLRNQ